jgi:RNA-directed DNA polymerase
VAPAQTPVCDLGTVEAGSARFAELRRRAVNADLANQTARSDHGPWRLADSPTLSIALPNAYFDSLGIPRLTVKPIA